MGRRSQHLPSDTRQKRWPGSAAVERQACDKEVVGSTPDQTLLRSILGQVIHTYVVLSPSGLICCWPKCGDVLRQGR